MPHVVEAFGAVTSEVVAVVEDEVGKGPAVVAHGTVVLGELVLVSCRENQDS